MADERNTLSSFITAVRTDGLAKPTLFSVEFSKKFGFTDQQLERVLLFCEQTELPGLNFEILQHTTYTNNTRFVPYNVQYSQQILSFYLDSKMFIKSFFDRWVQEVLSPEGNSFNFPARYTTNINIYKLDRAHNKVYKVTLIDAYPVALQPVDMGYGFSNEISRLPVLFQFTRWESTVIDQSGNEVVGDLEIDSDVDRFVIDRTNQLVQKFSVIPGNQEDFAVDREIMLPSINNISSLDISI